MEPIMKTRIIIIAALLTAFFAAPAVASLVPEGAARSAGINYAVGSVFGIQGEVDISSLTNKAPVSAQVFCKNYSQKSDPGVSWSTTGIGAAAIYDFDSIARLEKGIHPYAGIGLMYVSYKWRGVGPAPLYSGARSGLYLVGGARYVLTPKVAADLNYNVLGDFTAGVNYSF
jgi:opacity protein-like surface antigen